MTQPIEGTGQSAGAGGQSATTTDGNTSTTATGAQSGAGETANTAPATVSREEFEAIKRQLQAADQNRSKAEQEAKALRDAQLTEEEKRKQDLEAAQKALAERDAALRTAQIQNAFLTDNTFKWHDPKAALKLADTSGVKIEGDKVEGLKEALKAVADAYPFMVQPKEDTGSEGSGASGGTETSVTTGVGGQGASQGRTGSGNKAELEKRFPALRGRVS